MAIKGCRFNSWSMRQIRADAKFETRRPLDLWKNVKPGSCTKGFHDIDLSRGVVRLNQMVAFLTGGEHQEAVLHAPFKHREEDWERDPEYDTVTRIYPTMKVGDILWCREACYVHCAGNIDGSDRYILYAADHPEGNPIASSWTNNLYMPKLACREWLEVTSVRVEMLHDITEAGAIAEGCASIEEYFEVWDSIYKNKPEKQSSANPWDIVICFKRVPKPEGWPK